LNCFLIISVDLGAPASSLPSFEKEDSWLPSYCVPCGGFY
jgi:hypothetical protein